MTTETIKLLPAYVDEPTHSYVASDEETQVSDVEYTDITLEQNDLSSQDDSECPYIRVGTDYYREVLRPQANGTTCKCLVYWKASIIKADFGKDYLNDVPKYDCFCTVPSHTDYRKIVGNAYNLYEPITHHPEPGDWSAIDSLLRHIFEEHYEYGLDYIQLLYQMPLQKLPILILVSEQRNTGKTTFLNLLKAIFQDNATFNTNEDFRSKFNSDWAGKLLIMVDEVLLSRREDSERLKNLSTATSYKMESKGKDRNEIAFFGKFVLCSNNEHFPIVIDREEVRYWVRKVNPLETDDPFYMKKLVAQIPAFLHFLMQRELSVQCENRMWFSPERLRTAALNRIVISNRSKIEFEVAELLIEIMDYTRDTSVSFVVNDLAALLNYRNVRAETSDIRRLLQIYWHLKPASNSLTYRFYSMGIPPAKYTAKTSVGRYYTVTKDFILNLSLF